MNDWLLPAQAYLDAKSLLELLEGCYSSRLLPWIFIRKPTWAHLHISLPPLSGPVLPAATVPAGASLGCCSVSSTACTPQQLSQWALASGITWQWGQSTLGPRRQLSSEQQQAASRGEQHAAARGALSSACPWVGWERPKRAVIIT